MWAPRRVSSSHASGCAVASFSIYCVQVPSLLKLPTRVVDVAVEPPRLYITRQGQWGQYAALSYCWGGPQSILNTKATLEALNQNILVSKLPKTLQDAIMANRKLQLRYLWVDSLCIIQDDDEDKKERSRGCHKSMSKHMSLFLLLLQVPVTRDSYKIDRGNQIKSNSASSPVC